MSPWFPPFQHKNGFAYLRWLVVMALVLCGLGLGGYFFGVLLPKRKKHNLMTRNLANLHAIAAGCRSFARDHEGLYPSYQASGPSAPLARASDAFQWLLPQYVAKESFFWLPSTHPGKRELPREDGMLEPSECVYFFVRGLSEDFPGSPLLGDGLMSEPGRYSEHHPFLALGKAAVCFGDTRVEIVELSGTQAGATLGAKGNILVRRAYNEEGVSNGGLLPVDPSQVLLPE